jgi:hypothetical protein
MFGRWGTKGVSFAIASGVLGAALAFNLGSCAPADGDGFNSESVLLASCQAAPDQRGSFMAKVNGFPLHLQADATFSQSERASIQEAVERWNDLGLRLTGSAFFDLQFVPASGAARTADPRDCSATAYGNADTFTLLRETSQSRWRSLGFTDSIPGATLRCFSGTRVDHQVVLIYINVVDPAQLSSVILHELGHALGLDHSCFNGAGKSDFISCTGLAESHPYHLAVMFPSLRSRRSAFELPEIKDELGDNDQMRTACIYGGH